MRAEGDKALEAAREQIAIKVTPELALKEICILRGDRSVPPLDPNPSAAASSRSSPPNLRSRLRTTARGTQTSLGDDRAFSAA